MSTTETEVNIEEIMGQIRELVLARKMAQGGGQAMNLALGGRRLPPAFYEHLYQAGLSYDQAQVKLYLSKTSVPVVGPLLQWLREKVHQLVLFYVNQSAAQQINVNSHLLQALSILAEEFEREDVKRDA
ncbi:MAG: hypothetical protein AB1791_07615 [Chloroflexota bacterium]